MAEINYLNKIKELLANLPQELHVEFSLHCAKDSRQFANKKDLIVIDAAINLTERWLRRRNVTSQQLEQAANSAANSVYSAANSAYSAAYSAYSAAYSTNSAYSAKLKEYYEYLISLIKNLSTLEKIVYGLTQIKYL